MPVWGTGGRWFESSHPDGEKRKNLSVRFLRFVEDKILGENSVKYNNSNQ